MEEVLHQGISIPKRIVCASFPPCSKAPAFWAPVKTMVQGLQFRVRV